MLVEKLFQNINEVFALDNPFETHKIRTVFDNLLRELDKMFGKEDPCSYEKMYDMISALSAAERERAFIVGYKTAVQLLLEGTATDLGPD